MAMILTPSFDLRTPDKLAAFIHKYASAQPNAKKSAREILAGDIVCIDGHPCRIADPPDIAFLEGLSGAGYEDPRDEEVVLVRGVGVRDGKEDGRLYGLEEGIECFVDRHDEREWLVKGLQGKWVVLQAPRNPKNRWMIWLEPDKSPCFAILARNLPGRVYFRIYRQMGLNMIISARDAPTSSAQQLR